MCDYGQKTEYSSISLLFISNLIKIVKEINLSISSSLNKIILQSRTEYSYDDGFSYSNTSFKEIEQVFIKSNCKWNIKKQTGMTQLGFKCDELVIFRTFNN